VKRAWLTVLLIASGCFKAWDVGGPWACSADGTCPSGLTCDDGVCCTPGGSPACPTLPLDGQCPPGKTPLTLFRDRDGDGAGDPLTSRTFCAMPVKEKWVREGDDCNDTDATVGPRATERCNAQDDDCDGVVDDGTPLTTWYRDDDGDGFGQNCTGCTMEACARPQGFADRAGDCNDADASVHPGALERCNGVDDNCNNLPDDAPYSDVESPGFDGGLVVPCDAGRPGVCGPGGVQCVYSLFDDGGSGFRPTCVPRNNPQPDLCGDGVDSDCSGVADDAPGCGGPPVFINAPGARVRAVAVDAGVQMTDSRLPLRCLADEPGAEAMSWLNPAWIGTTGLRHVWSIEAPDGFTWDLSRRDAAVALHFTVKALGHTDAGYPWNTTWGDATWFRGPVVTLCGVQGDEFLRLVPDEATALTANQSSFSATVPLWNAHPGWTEETGPTRLNPRRVKRLEVVVSPVPSASRSMPDLITFTIEWLPDAGLR
jgi:hypothetical protein